MGSFVKGDVVVLNFPFSDLSGSKKRPAFVLTDLPGEDIILCQLTSKAKSDPFALLLEPHDFITGGLPVVSLIRPNKIFTADKNLIFSVAGHLSERKTNDVLNAVIAVILAKI